MISFPPEETELSQPTPPSRRGPWLRGLLLFLLPFLLYLPSHRGEFAVDDFRFIVDNGANLERVREPWLFFLEPMTNSVSGDGDIYRPLRTLSFAIDHLLFGLNPLGFHLHNVLLHALVGLLLYRLLRRTTSENIGFVTALLFVAHPLNSEAVAWISGRSDLQGALLALMALLAARRGEQSSDRRWCIVAAGGALLAGLGKETAVMVPFLYLLEHRLRAGAWIRSAIGPFVALVVGVGLYLTIYVAVRGEGISGQVDFYHGSFVSHLPYGLIGLARMLRLTLLPTGLNFYHEPELFQPLTALDVSLAVLGLATALVLVAATFRRRLPVAVGIVWFFVAIAPATNIALPIRTVLSERFTYLPMMGILLAMGSLLVGHGQPIRVAFRVVPLLVLMSIGTWQRASDWSRRESLHRATLASWPNSFAAALGLASDLERQGLPKESLPYWEQAQSATTDPLLRLRALYGYGHSAMLAGEFRVAVDRLGEIDRTLSQHPDWVDQFPQGADARYDLAFSLSRMIRFDLAAEVFDRLIEVHGETPERLDARGEVERARASTLCLEFYERALRLDPNYHVARIHFAEVMKKLPGFEGEARRQLKEVLARDPANERARQLLERFRVDEEDSQ